MLLRDGFAHDVEIVADDSVRIDRSLDSARLRSVTGWRAPSWEAMVAELSGERSREIEGRQPLAGR
jgi:dTDP-4-dehydrorhamnose reductase